MTAPSKWAKRESANPKELGPEHQIVKPELMTGMTGFGEFTKPGSQVEMTKTPQSWDDPILTVPGSGALEWL